MIYFIWTRLDSFRKQRMVNCENASCKAKSAEPKVFNDPIHGHIELPEICVKIINTPEFLRLRNIKQLGATYQVFPGAAHNRFEHCIGVSYLAGEFGRHLKNQIDKELEEKKGAFSEAMKITPRDIICLQVAGLCHDIGHGPMSHAFESRFVHILNPTSKWKHENASCYMFDHLLDKHKEIKIRPRDKETSKYTEDEKKKLDEEEKEDRAFIKNLIHRNKQNDLKTGRGPEKGFLYEIVSNEENGIDVDKFDYFARDSYHLGFKNNFDHKRLIKFSRVMKADGAWHICYRDKQVEDIYHMFLSRVILHQRACMHKTAQVLERMYMEVLEDANDKITFTGRNGIELTILESIYDMEAFAKLTDNVFSEIQHSPNENLKKSKEILEKINKRKHYRLISEAIPPKEWPQKEQNKQKEQKEQKEQEFSDTIKAEKRILKEIIAMNVDMKPDEDSKSNKNWNLKEEDLLVDIVSFSFGRGNKNPVDNVYFYNKVNKCGPFKMEQKDVSQLLPDTYGEIHIRLFARSEDDHVLQEARKRFTIWCKKKKMDGKWKYFDP